MRDHPSELEALVYLFHRYSNLPEIYDFLTDETVNGELPDRQFLKFLDRFGGMTLVIPPRERVAEVVRDLHIYRSMLQNDTRLNRERLASLYHLDPSHVKQIEGRVEKLMEKCSPQFQDWARTGRNAGRLVADDREGPGALLEEPMVRKRKKKEG